MSKTKRLQSKIVIPTDNEQTITPDNQFDGLQDVVIKAIPNEYIIPTGEIQITSNGATNISKYEFVNIDVKPSLQEKTAVLSKATQVVKPDVGYYGLAKVDIPAIPNDYIIPTGDLSINTNGTKDVKSYASVTVNVLPTLQQKTVTPSNKPIVVEADYDYNGLLSVTVDAIPDEYIVPSGEIRINENGKTDVSKLSSVVVDVKPALQSKAVVPSAAPQIVVADANYDGLSLVNVAAIPDKYIVPEGAKNITANGTVDVTAYSAVNVDVTPSLQSKEVTPTKERQVVKADSLHDGLSEVAVSPIPDIYIIPFGSSAITKNGTVDVTTLSSVVVDVKPELQSKTVTPTSSPQVIKADDTFDGLASVRVEAIPSKYIIPSGVVAVSSNGEVDVSKYSKAVVNIQPELQAIDIVPTKSKQTVKPDFDHYGLSEVTVDAIPEQYIITDDADAIASEIVSGKTAYVNGKKVVGELETQHCFTGSMAPSDSLGKNGDIYIRIGS